MPSPSTLHVSTHPAVQHKLAVLREHCDRLGRSYDKIVKSSTTRLHVTRDGRNGTSTPAQVIERFAAVRELGITWIDAGIPNAADPDAFDLIGSHIVPEMAKL